MNNIFVVKATISSPLFIIYVLNGSRFYEAYSMNSIPLICELHEVLHRLFVPPAILRRWNRTNWWNHSEERPSPSAFVFAKWQTSFSMKVPNGPPPTPVSLLSRTVLGSMKMKPHTLEPAILCGVNARARTADRVGASPTNYINFLHQPLKLYPFLLPTEGVLVSPLFCVDPGRVAVAPEKKEV